jgi:hypothetical protein
LLHGLTRCHSSLGESINSSWAVWAGEGDKGRRHPWNKLWLCVLGWAGSLRVLPSTAWLVLLVWGLVDKCSPPARRWSLLEVVWCCATWGRVSNSGSPDPHASADAAARTRRDSDIGSRRGLVLSCRCLNRGSACLVALHAVFPRRGCFSETGRARFIVRSPPWRPDPSMATPVASTLPSEILLARAPFTHSHGRLPMAGRPPSPSGGAHAPCRAAAGMPAGPTDPAIAAWIGVRPLGPAAPPVPLLCIGAWQSPGPYGANS